MNAYRPNSICISEEVGWYLKILCKKVVAGTDASITRDQLGDNILRNAITTDNPDLVLKYEEYLERKQQRKKEADAWEQKVIASLAENELQLPS